jgi:ribosomal protein S1
MSFELGRFPIGDVVTGRIVELEPRGVLVDFGAEQPAYVPVSKLCLVDIETPQEAVQLNEIREFLVVGNYDSEHDFFFSNCSPETLIDSNLLYEAVIDRASLNCERPVRREELLIHTRILNVEPDEVRVRVQWFLCSERPPTITFSIRALERQTAWRRIQQLQTEDVTLHLEILKKTRYSVLVEVEGLRGAVNNVDRCKEELVVGQRLSLKILDSKERLSNFKPLEIELIQSSTLNKLRQFQVGQILNGRVHAVKPYGVWINIDGIYALLHRSKIARQIDNLEQVFKANDSVKATIAEINLQRARVNLESCEKLAEQL